MVDADKDGKATIGEVEAFAAHSGLTNPPAIQCIREAWGLTEKGAYLGKEEFCAYMQPNSAAMKCVEKHGTTPEDPRNGGCTINEIDINGDGHATLAEVEAALKAHVPGAEDPVIIQCVMEGWDVDANGEVTSEEFCTKFGTIIPMCMKKHGGGGPIDGHDERGGQMEEFWAQFGLRDAAVADNCDGSASGACCFVPRELEDAFNLCMISLSPNGPDSFSEEPWNDACLSPQCTSSFQLLDEIAARKGALCEKLEPLLHGVSSLGAAVCAPDDLHDGQPCITNAVSVLQQLKLPFLVDMHGPKEDEEAEEEELPVGLVDTVPDDRYASVQRASSLLRAFHDVVGLREGPAEVVRALMARMPGSHGVDPAPSRLRRKVVHHAHRYEVVHHAHHRRGRARVLNARRSKRFLLNQAPLALAQFGTEKLDLTQTLDSFCTPCVDSILSAAAGVVPAEKLLLTRP
jgi:hypothetical protein